MAAGVDAAISIEIIVCRTSEASNDGLVQRDKAGTQNRKSQTEDCMAHPFLAHCTILASDLLPLLLVAKFVDGVSRRRERILASEAAQ